MSEQLSSTPVLSHLILIIAGVVPMVIASGLTYMKIRKA